MDTTEWTFEVKDQDNLYIVFVHKNDEVKNLIPFEKEYLERWLGRMTEKYENLFLVKRGPEIIMLLEALGFTRGGNAIKVMHWLESKGLLTQQNNS